MRARREAAGTPTSDKGRSLMVRVLLTGFEPFGAIRGNASWEAVESAVRRPVEGVEMAAARLPVTFEGAQDTLMAEVDRLRPDLVIAVGQAPPVAERSLWSGWR